MGVEGDCTYRYTVTWVELLLAGTEVPGGGGRGRLYLTPHCHHHQKDFRTNIGSDETFQCFIDCEDKVTRRWSRRPQLSKHGFMFDAKKTETGKKKKGGVGGEEEEKEKEEKKKKKKKKRKKRGKKERKNKEKKKKKKQAWQQAKHGKRYSDLFQLFITLVS